MKLLPKIIAGAAVAAFLTTTAFSLKADTTNTITVTITASAQGSVSDNGTNTVAAAPSKHSVTTAVILNWLAVAETAELNYTNSTFPSGAKLVVINNDFQVLDASNHLLVDVSDIISAEDGAYGNDVFSGKQNDVTGLANTSKTELHIMTIHYDDTGIIGSTNVKFYLTGLMTSTTTDTVPNSITSVYTESQSHKLASGTGEAIYQGQQVVLTGTLSAAGKGTFVY